MWAAAAPASPEDRGLCLSTQDKQGQRIWVLVLFSCVSVLQFKFILMCLLLVLLF